jgi:formylglycine-generating enzyme
MIQSQMLAGLMVGLVTAAAQASPVTFDWALVGNPGNDSDDTTLGRVNYSYAISKTEVTNSQYATFLNAADPEGTNSKALYNPEMAGDFGGIELHAGAAAGGKYVAMAGRGQKPVTYVSFFDAMRFVNWLHSGQGPAGSPWGETETGVYRIGNGIKEVRLARTYWIPSQNEWYKAAYHDATSGAEGVYFDYANASNILPVSDQPGDDPSATNYFYDDGIENGFNDGFAAFGSAELIPGMSPLTDVGAYVDATSPYGTFDQGGNVKEWTEKAAGSALRVVEGGSWSTVLRAGSPDYQFPSDELATLGFRVASVPEPCAAILASMALLRRVERRR